jgi:hypothetical protein
MHEVKESVNQSARHELALPISIQRERVHGEYRPPSQSAQPKKAQKIEQELMRDLRNGNSNQAIQPVSLKAVIDEFRRLAEPRYRAHPNSFKRINTSLVSATSFFGAKLVSEIDAGAIEEYVSWRIVESRVKDITVRHDLYALSRFFATAIRKRWASNNPIREIEIPSDTDAVRIHPLTMHEEEQYFRRASTAPGPRAAPGPRTPPAPLRSLTSMSTSSPRASSGCSRRNSGPTAVKIATN